MLIKVNLTEPDETKYVDELKTLFNEKTGSGAVTQAIFNYKKEYDLHKFYENKFHKKCEELRKLKEALEMKEKANSIINEFLYVDN